MLEDVRMAVRLARDSRAFLGRPYRAEDCHRLPKDPFARRDASFLRIMARAVCGNARSPYFALMRQAKVRYGDVARRGFVARASRERWPRSTGPAYTWRWTSSRGAGRSAPGWTAPARCLEAPV